MSKFMMQTPFHTSENDPLKKNLLSTYPPIFDKILFLNKFIFLFAFMLPLSVFSQNVKPYFQQRADYKIEISLNDVTRTLDGFEVIDYQNNSTDTLHFIWFHLWPNAYKNDRTEFSEQFLRLGRTDFYFSNEEQRGYINRLDFKVNNVTATLQPHPQYIDVAKLILPQPLAPGSKARITTPFHVKLPFNFSRGGYVDDTYQVTQWYPKPAVYDREGWHPMPYVDQGEFYSEFGKYDVKITVPEQYKIAATGVERSASEMSDQFENLGVPSKTNTASYYFSQDSIHDFAWFADKRFIVEKDTMQLPSGRVIQVASYYTPEGKSIWKKSLQFLKRAIQTRSEWLGEYPYPVVSVVEAKMGFSGGMEYPTITSISPVDDEKSLDLVIEHEVGHNWNYGILATNERDYPWMDEGINTFYDNRYEAINYGNKNETPSQGFFAKKLPEDWENFAYRISTANKTDQAINTPSQRFSEINYGLTAYYKAGKWMKVLEDYVGTSVFDEAMHQYYKDWQFKHPYQSDLQSIFRSASEKNTDSIFSLLNLKGPLSPMPKKAFKPAFLFNLNETDKYNYVFFSPAFGANYYDKIMVGALIHNYTLPEPKFHFLLAPMYGTGSKSFTGLGRIGYNIMSYGLIRKAEISLSGATFSVNDFTDSTGHTTPLPIYKIVPSLKLTFRNSDPTNAVTKWIQWKTYFFNETRYLFSRDTITQQEFITYPKTDRYLNQLTFAINNDRVLYPYDANLKAEQAKGFMRFAFTGNYFFNFAKGGGVQARLFAGKLIYTGDNNFIDRRYYLNMSGADGSEDYTYSNYFIGRNEFDNIASQQMMMRDGAFKVRTDFLSNKIGRSDDWLTALNLNMDINSIINTRKIFPVKLPVKLFLDIGTYADAWKKEAATGKFIYDAGFQVSLVKDLVNIYVPVLYSSVYRNYFKSIPQEGQFWKKISFSIDIQNVRLSQWIHGLGL